MSYKIVFSGGGTLGPVTPLLAIFKVIKEKYPEAEFIWVGTKNGPEKELIEKNGIRFVSFSAGKLRRYFSVFNIFDLFKILAGFFESLKFLKKEKPSLCISAGGFVSVPLHWAAKFKKIPTWVHQQDVRVGLSNKLMSSSATVISTALQKNVNNFPEGKTVWLGNPVRSEILEGSREEALKLFSLSGDRPVVFVTGGGTGAENVNNMVAEAVEKLKDVCQIIHLYGKEREHKKLDELASQNSYYKIYPFFTTEMKQAYAAADLVVSRGGFGTLTELSALKKPSIIIPIPGAQAENVKFLADDGAVALLDEKTDDGAKLAGLVKDILSDKTRMENMRNKLSELIPVAKKEDILSIFDKALGE